MRLIRSAVLLPFLVAPGGAAFAADDPHAHHRHAAPAVSPGAEAVVRLKFPDASLVDADGQRRALASDVLGDRLVVMNFVYTSCTTVCPVVSAVFARLQDRLGPRLGPEVRLVSLSVDPARDTPEVLKAYSARHGARPDWVWLTGRADAVDGVLKAAGTWTPNFADHPAVTLIGDAKSGEWTRLYGFPSADEILDRLAALAAGRPPAAQTAHDPHHHHH